jgi:ribA/ribD-fused uncharacterized protein
MKQIDDFRGDYFFLSNFYPVGVNFDGAPYDSVEHAFQAAKTADPVQRVAFRRQGMTPGQAKRLGRAIECRSDWEAIKNEVMKTILLDKFSVRNIVLRHRLLETQGMDLIEDNTHHDQIWGNCICSRPRCGSEQGQNRLGILLMEVRDQIIKETTDENSGYRAA